MTSPLDPITRITTTTNASTATSATLHPMTSKRLTLPETPTTTQQKTKTHTLRKTQGESGFIGDRICIGQSC